MVWVCKGKGLVGFGVKREIEGGIYMRIVIGLDVWMVVWWGC